MDYKIVRSNRKTLALEVTLKGEILVRSPYLVTENTIAEFVNSHENWILKTLKKQELRRESNPEPTAEEVTVLKAKAKEILPERVKFWSEKTGLKCTKITVTSAKTRFGSCSGKNSISFSYLLMRHPIEVVDYVVLHELAHTKHHNHSKRFWNLVEKYMPDYKSKRDLLKM
ncbi:MAG: M48 family metallopeptidase [Clostridia bacterium]|nr:M48 family metallopeptidase [Clostridia bacterium]